MLAFVSWMRLTTACVRLKMEYLSGLTDLVVSTTKVSGGLMTELEVTVETGQSLQLQLTHLLVPPPQSASSVQPQPAGKALHWQSTQKPSLGQSESRLQSQPGGKELHWQSLQKRPLGQSDLRSQSQPLGNLLQLQSTQNSPPGQSPSVLHEQPSGNDWKEELSKI